MARVDVKIFNLMTGLPAARCRGVVLAITAFWVALILSGCVTDSDSDCEYPLRLRFSYVFNREDRDLLREETDMLCLYLYDMASGRLVASRNVATDQLGPDNSLEWNVAPGRHTLVVWAFSRDGAASGRYCVTGHEDGFFNHTLALVHDSNIPGSQLAAASQSRQHLWHSCHTDIMVNGDITPVYDIELRKVSNDVNVSVYVQGLPADSECLLSATDGKYSASGQVSATVPSFYMPVTVPAAPPSGYDSGTRHEFTTLGLWASDDSHLRLVMQGTDTPVYDGSLTELIDRLPHLDYTLDDTFNLDFFIRNSGDGTMQVSVSVNDWEIVNYNVALK